MGCKCKDTARKVSKYTDEETIREVHGAEKAAMFVSKIFTVILLFVILIIAAPFLVAYAVFAVVTGRSINIGKLFKKHGKRKQIIQNQN
jgi:hypothetical protein